MNSLLLEHARMMATLIVNRLQGRVRRVAVAGSIRRERETVGGIDLLLIPKEKMPFMFRGEMVRIENGEGTPERIIKFAEMIFRPVSHDSTPTLFVLKTVFNKDDMTPEGIQVSIAIASEANWGHCLLFRTGNREFNEYLHRRALSRGLCWSPYSNNAAAPDGIFDPNTLEALPATTEMEIFDALKLDYVEPRDRERVGKLEVKR